VRAKSRWSSRLPLCRGTLWAKPSSRKPHFFSTRAEPRLAGMTAAPTRWRPSSPRATSKILLTVAMAYPRLQYSTLTQHPRWQPAPELRSRPQACSTRARIWLPGRQMRAVAQQQSQYRLGIQLRPGDKPYCRGWVHKATPNNAIRAKPVGSTRRFQTPPSRARSTQNSLPSGSASTTQVASGRCPTSARVAPSPIRRATSASRSSGLRSM